MGGPDDGAIIVIIHRCGLPEPDATGHRDGWQHFLARLETVIRQEGTTRKSSTPVDEHAGPRGRLVHAKADQSGLAQA